MNKFYKGGFDPDYQLILFKSLIIIAVIVIVYLISYIVSYIGFKVYIGISSTIATIYIIYMIYRKYTS
jgi:hypothetical protein